MTAPQAVVRVGAKAPRLNKKLLIVLGVVIVLALASQVFPSLLGGGSGAVKAFQPSTYFHHTKVTTPTTPGANNPSIAVRPTRDPFAPPR